MHKVAMFIYADTEGKGDLGRLVNAFQAAKEFNEGGDKVEIILDGAGTKWVKEFENTDHKYKPLYDDVKDLMKACSYCAEAFKVKEDVQDANIPLVDESKGHPSFKNYFDQDFKVLTF